MLTSSLVAYPLVGAGTRAPVLLPAGGGVTLRTSAGAGGKELTDGVTHESGMEVSGVDLSAEGGHIRRCARPILLCGQALADSGQGVRVDHGDLISALAGGEEIKSARRRAVRVVVARGKDSICVPLVGTWGQAVVVLRAYLQVDVLIN